MDDFDRLKAELAAVKNLSALARETKLSRKHLQRIRDGESISTTIRTLNRIREGIKALSVEKQAA